jgi:hypothetical protein
MGSQVTAVGSGVTTVDRSTAARRWAAARSCESPHTHKETNLVSSRIFRVLNTLNLSAQAIPPEAV